MMTSSRFIPPSRVADGVNFVFKKKDTLINKALNVYSHGDVVSLLLQYLHDQLSSAVAGAAVLFKKWRHQYSVIFNVAVHHYFHQQTKRVL